MNKIRNKAFAPVVLFFLIVNALLLTQGARFEGWNLDSTVVIIGNLLLFVITFISILVGRRGLKNPNPHAFVRSVYGSIMVKLFLCIIAALIYISMYGKDLNKPALFTCMALYLIYTFLEVSVLMKMLKKTNE